MTSSLSSSSQYFIVKNNENEFRSGYLIKSHDGVVEIYDDNNSSRVINKPIPTNKQVVESITQKQFWFLCEVKVSERIEKMESKQGQFLNKLRLNHRVCFKDKKSKEWVKGRFVSVNDTKELSIYFWDERHVQRTALVPIWEVFDVSVAEDEEELTTITKSISETKLVESSIKQSKFRIAEQTPKSNKPFVCARADNEDVIIDWKITDNKTLIFNTLQNSSVSHKDIHIENPKGKLTTDEIFRIANVYLQEANKRQSQKGNNKPASSQAKPSASEQNLLISDQLNLPSGVKPHGLELGKEMVVKLEKRSFTGIVKWTGTIEKKWFVGMEVQEENLTSPIIRQHPQLLNKFPCSIDCSFVLVEAEFVRPIMDGDVHKMYFSVPYNQHFFQNLIKDPDDNDLRIGWCVHVNLSIQNQQVGICRWIGHHSENDVRFVGVELKQPVDFGGTNGTFPNKKGIKLFECPTKCGVVVPRSSIIVSNLPISSETDANPILVGGVKKFCNVPHDVEFMKLLIQQDATAPTAPNDKCNFHIHSKVQVSLIDAHLKSPNKPTGECVYIGQHKNTDEYFIGVVLDNEVNCEAVTDGTFPKQNGIKLFTCQEHKGVLLPLKRVHKFHLEECKEKVELISPTTIDNPFGYEEAQIMQMTMPTQSANIQSSYATNGQTWTPGVGIAAAPSIYLKSRYKKLSNLDHGCFGIVTLVHDSEESKKKVQKKIALKHVEAENDRIKQEAQILVTLKDHPCVVKCHDHYTYKESFIILTEYCEGGTLSSEIDKALKNGTNLDEQVEVLPWLTEILKGIEFIHSCHILHRDLHPKNIFLKNNEIKIGDFGLSRVLENTADYVTGVGASLYMSPEVYMKGTFSSKSDIWSVGCILYEMCALKPAFPANPLMVRLNKICAAEYDPLPELYSEEIIFLLSKMLVVDTGERCSAPELLKLRVIKPFVSEWMGTGLNSMQIHERYIKKRNLGRGAFGKVWLVEDNKIGSGKVLKKIPLDGEEKENEKTQREAEILVSLNHRFVVKYHDDYTLQNSFFIVMEYCEGGTVGSVIKETLLKKTTLDTKNILLWITQILIGLQYIHSRRIVHRDLHPFNVFLKENNIKIGDFGLSRKLENTSNYDGTKHGSLPYMGPEFHEHNKFHVKSDIWSAGCILYEMGTLKPAFSLKFGFAQLSKKICKGQYEPLPADYSSDVKDLLSKMLVIEVSERFSASDLLELSLIKKDVP